MTSYVDMSLEDIIQKRKRENVSNKSLKTNKTWTRVPPQKLEVTDARNKIISKKRTQITDAREKLAELAKQKDARLKLEKLRQERAKLQGRNAFQSNGKFSRTVPNKQRVFTDSTRQVVSQPLKASKITRSQNNFGRFMENRAIERSQFTGRQGNFGGQSRSSNDLTPSRLTTQFAAEVGQVRHRATRTLATVDRTGRNAAPLYKIKKPKPILRTVENDLEIIDDPMEDEYMPSRSSLLNRKASLQLKIVTHNNDIRENRVATVHSTAVTERESPPRLPSILKKRPTAAIRNNGKTQKTEKPLLEYRIIVSNLRNTVTAGDIEELFGDVGGMVESRLVRPGTAEVIYKTQDDAQKAVDLYHNRQLDGQPMNCLLVTPRSPSSSARSSSKPALYSTNSNVEPDISTFHKVLFSNL